MKIRQSFLAYLLPFLFAVPQISQASQKKSVTCKAVPADYEQKQVLSLQLVFFDKGLIRVKPSDGDDYNHTNLAGEMVVAPVLIWAKP